MPLTGGVAASKGEEHFLEVSRDIWRAYNTANLLKVKSEPIAASPGEARMIEA